MAVVMKNLYCNRNHFWNVCHRLSTLPAVDPATSKKVLHIPVMAKEVIESLQPESGQVLIDMTFGAGGHSRKILQSASNITLITLDRDPVSHEVALKLAEAYPGQIVPLLGKFSDIPELLSAHGIKHHCIDGILLDLGCSSMQFDIAERGFSVSKDGPLDMRMDGSRCCDTPTAADILAQADEEDLARIFKVYGEEKKAKKIARAIIEARYTFKKLEKTSELSELVATVCGGDHRLDKLHRHSHAATKTFQALRIFVNNEVNELNYAMIIAQAYLKPLGRLVTLTFHSLEDRIVKRHLSGNVTENAINPLPLRYSNPSMCYDKETVDCLFESGWQPVHKHVLTPSADEVEANPRSRSAKLRAAIKIKDSYIHANKNTYAQVEKDRGSP